jgi:hypothetical protein
MAECYLFAVCESSTLDKETNNWSLFNLINGIELKAAAPPQGSEIILPLELHTHWRFTDAEIGETFYWRIVSSIADQINASKPYDFQIKTTHHRHRVKGLPILLEGSTAIFAEWRIGESQQWVSNPLKWPLRIARVAPASGT